MLPLRCVHKFQQGWCDLRASIRCQAAVLNQQKKKEVYTSTVKGSEYVQPINMTWLYVNYTLILKYIIKKNALAHKDLWQWLTDHAIPKNELDWKTVRIFNLCNKLI